MQELAKYRDILSGFSLSDEEVFNLVTLFKGLSGEILDEQFKASRQGGNLLPRVKRKASKRRKRS
jgi:hypothetical protein